MLLQNPLGQANISPPHLSYIVPPDVVIDAKPANSAYYQVN